MVYVRFPLSLRNVEDFSSRTRALNQSRNRTIFVEQIWSNVRSQDPAETDRWDAFLLKLALAFGRGVCEEQKQDALPLANCGS